MTVEIALKNKKAVHKSGKLFIGLTTKPAASYKVAAKTTQLSLGIAFGTKKVSVSENLFPILRSGRDSNPRPPA